MFVACYIPSGVASQNSTLVGVVLRGLLIVSIQRGVVI